MACPGTDKCCPPGDIPAHSGIPTAPLNESVAQTHAGAVNSSNTHNPADVQMVIFGLMILIGTAFIVAGLKNRKLEFNINFNREKPEFVPLWFAGVLFVVAGIVAILVTNPSAIYSDLAMSLAAKIAIGVIAGLVVRLLFMVFKRD